jgi:hypothetical protein
MSLKIKRGFEEFLGKNITPMMYLVIIAFSWALSWWADGIAEFLPESFKGVAMLGLSIVVFIGVWTYVAHLRKQYPQEEVVEIDFSESKPKKVLLVFLSIHHGFDKLEPALVDRTSIGKKKRDNLLSSWQMPLEAIYFHKDRLEKCIVFTSKESDRQYPKFEEVVRKIFDGSRFEMTNKWVDMSTPTEIIEAYRTHYDALRKEGYPNSEIVFDITSGSKLVSIAGSFFALAEDRIIEYVDQDTYEVKMFNNHIVSDT